MDGGWLIVLVFRAINVFKEDLIQNFIGRKNNLKEEEGNEEII